MTSGCLWQHNKRGTCSKRKFFRSPKAFFYSGVHLLLYFTRKSLYLLGGEARVMFIKSKKGEEMFEGKMVLCNVKAFPHRTPQEVWGVWGLDLICLGFNMPFWKTQIIFAGFAPVARP